MNNLDNICIILVETSHPGNIGAVARAMKTMGLHHLRLVNPKDFPSQEAIARASNADDILDNAQVYPSIADALRGCSLAIATTARARPSLQWKTLDLPQIGQHLPSLDDSNRLAILFGPERTGLTNQQLAHCDYYLTIPCNPDYSSLNLAACVQIVCYELRKAHVAQPSTPNNTPSEPLADHHQLELLFDQLQTIMQDTGFTQTDDPKKLMLRLRRLFIKRQLTASELHLLRGILKAIEQAL